MATDGGLVAAQIAGLARSEDGGCTWAFPEARLSDVFVTDLTVHAGAPDVMWAATGTSKQANSVYRSDDGGRNWKRLTMQVEDIRLNRIEVAASDADVLYASGNRPADAAEASAAGFLFRSDDGGESWRRWNVELDAQGFEVELLAVDPGQPDRLYARVVRSAADALMLSEDGGAH